MLPDDVAVGDTVEVEMVVRNVAGRLDVVWLLATVTRVSKAGVGVVYPNGLRLTYSKRMKQIRKAVLMS